MPRVYKPTGLPVGRKRGTFSPKRIPGSGSPAQLKAARELVNRMRARKVPDTIPPFVPPPPEVLAGKSSKDQIFEHQKAIALQGLERMYAILSNLSVTDPDKAVELVMEHLEYVAPKLARTEITGSVEHRHKLFVPVESRETPPALDGEATEVAEVVATPPAIAAPAKEG